MLSHAWIYVTVTTVRVDTTLPSPPSTAQEPPCPLQQSPDGQLPWSWTPSPIPMNKGGEVCSDSGFWGSVLACLVHGSQKQSRSVEYRRGRDWGPRPHLSDHAPDALQSELSQFLGGSQANQDESLSHLPLPPLASELPCVSSLESPF